MNERYDSIQKLLRKLETVENTLRHVKRGETLTVKVDTCGPYPMTLCFLDGTQRKINEFLLRTLDDQQAEIKAELERLMAGDVAR